MDLITRTGSINLNPSLLFPVFGVWASLSPPLNSHRKRDLPRFRDISSPRLRHLQLLSNQSLCYVLSKTPNIEPICHLRTTKAAAVTHLACHFPIPHSHYPSSLSFEQPLDSPFSALLAPQQYLCFTHIDLNQSSIAGRAPQGVIHYTS